MQWKLSGQPCVMCRLTWGHNHKRNLCCSKFFFFNHIFSHDYRKWSLKNIYNLEYIMEKNSFSLYLLVPRFWELLVYCVECRTSEGICSLIGVHCPTIRGWLWGDWGETPLQGGGRHVHKKNCLKDKWMLQHIYKLGREVPFIAIFPLIIQGRLRIPHNWQLRTKYMK